MRRQKGRQRLLGNMRTVSNTPECVENYYEIRENSFVKYVHRLKYGIRENFLGSHSALPGIKCIIKTFPRRYESIPYQILLSILNRQMHNLSIVLGTVSKLSGTVSKLSGTVSKLSGTVSKLSFDASDHCLCTRSTLQRGVLRINQSS